MLVSFAWPKHVAQESRGMTMPVGAPSRPQLSAPARHVGLLIAFANSVDSDEGTDDLTAPSELADWLRERGVDRVDVCGIATDYCV